MKSYLKPFLFALAAAAGVYGTFFVDVGGRPLSTHAAEVWRSPIMQNKIQLVKKDVRNRIAQRLSARTADKQKGTSRGPVGTRAYDELHQADRDSLNALIDTVQKRP